MMNKELNRFWNNFMNSLLVYSTSDRPSGGYSPSGSSSSDCPSDRSSSSDCPSDLSSG
jgi:hypothetical protein